jgi:BA14K-like protein
MAFVFYFIVILVSVGSVIFAVDLASSPLPSTPNVPIGRVAQAPAPTQIKPASTEAQRAADDRALSPIYPAAPRVRHVDLAQPATSGASPQQASGGAWLPPAPPQQQAETSTQQPQQQAAAPALAANDEAKTAMAAPAANTTPPPAATQSVALCNIAACSAAYRSFRASDCTYQPFNGPRRACTATGGTFAASARPPRRRYQGVARRAADQHEIDEVTRIVRKMTRGERGDIAVQDSQGRIIIVRPGSANAYSPYDDYEGN